jgi:transposase-like protein
VCPYAEPLGRGLLGRCCRDNATAPEELLAERGVTVDHVTIYRWMQRLPGVLEAARPCRHAPGNRWFVDETYLKTAS